MPYGDVYRRYSPIFSLTSYPDHWFFLFLVTTFCKILQKFLAAFESVWEVKTIIALFVVVGAMSAAWRAAGTIPEIAASLIFLLSLFWLPSTRNYDVHAFKHRIWYRCNHKYHLHVYWWALREFFIGGAVLAGSYGDRCSLCLPAQSLFQLTDTNLSKNTNCMLRTSVVPYCCTNYVAWDFFMANTGTIPDITGLRANQTFTGPCNYFRLLLMSL